MFTSTEPKPLLGDETVEELREFNDELAKHDSSIKAIGSAWEHESNGLKAQIWNTAAKKDELTTFDEIYPVVKMAWDFALRTAHISFYTPSRNYVKLLVTQMTKTLPQENDEAIKRASGETADGGDDTTPKSNDSVDSERQSTIGKSDDKSFVRCPDCDCGRVFGDPETLCVLCLIIVFLCVGAGFIVDGTEKLKDAEKYKHQSTEETCLILSYEEVKCEFDCDDCKDYQKRYENVWCSADGDDISVMCGSWKYTYTATASSKCGVVELYSNVVDVEESCNGKNPLEIGAEVDCYILECSEKEFTIHDDSVIESVASDQIIAWVILMSLAIVGFCGWAACKAAGCECPDTDAHTY
eukprot:635102_1